MEIRRSYCLISTMPFPILVRQRLYIKSGHSDGLTETHLLALPKL